MTPKIGTVRVVVGPQKPTIYPGEMASATVSEEEFEAALASAASTKGARIEIAPTGWTVEPMPGRRGLYLRWRYRLVGRWLERVGIGRARINVSARVQDGRR